MACNLKSVLSNAASCVESPAGVSNFMMVLPLNNIASISVDDAHNRYIITGPSGGLKGFRIDFKAQTGQVTSESNPMGAGWSHTGTGRVEMNEDDMALVSRTLHNMDKFICLFPTGKKVEGGTEWKVVGNQFGECEWAVAADSGTARSDDHGQTFTVTCGFQVYPVMKFIGNVSLAEDDEFVDDSGDEETYGGSN